MIRCHSPVATLVLAVSMASAGVLAQPVPPPSPPAVVLVPAAPVAPTVAAPPAQAVAPQATPPVAPVPPRPAVASAQASMGTLVTLRDIDRESTGLSNDIAQSHARLQQMTAMVLDRVGGGAQLVVEHQNDMGSTFRLVRATYSLDGAVLATRVDENGSLADQQTFPVYNGRVNSGEHSLTVNLEYQGNGFGIFSYIRGYTFRARSVQTFTAPEGRALRLLVIGYERGGSTAAVEERPAIRYTQSMTTIAEAQAATARANAPTTAPAPASAAGQGAPAQRAP